MRTVAEKVRAVNRSVWEQNGSVYTKPWVVEFILDLTGYISSENLVDRLAIEPSCGSGEFLEGMIRRLIQSCRRKGLPIEDCKRSLLAFDIDSVAVDRSRERAIRVLVSEGCDEDVVAQIFGDQGFPDDSIQFGRSAAVPGYYRPTKCWDVLVVHKGILVAVVELKSIGSSFSNNMNNRAEEAIGLSTDLLTAYREGVFGTVKPWLGYLFLMADVDKVHNPSGTRACLVNSRRW